MSCSSTGSTCSAISYIKHNTPLISVSDGTEIRGGFCQAGDLTLTPRRFFRRSARRLPFWRQKNKYKFLFLKNEGEDCCSSALLCASARIKQAESLPLLPPAKAKNAHKTAARYNRSLIYNKKYVKFTSQKYKCNAFIHFISIPVRIN